MRISNIRRASATAYRHLHQGLSTASAVVEKSAHIYSLVQPLLRHADFDTSEVDAALMGAYSRYQVARSLAGKIDGVIN
jgi:hypothetical protein